MAKEVVKTAEITLDDMIGWLQTQPPDEEYIWQDPVNCLMGRYLKEHGSRWGEAPYSEMPGYYEIAYDKPWTFGAALGRAEALKALPPPSKADEALHEPALPPAELVPQ